MTGWFAAVDLGATSGRVLLAEVGPDTLRLEPVHRFANQPVATPDGLHWNILELYRQILYGLREAVRRQPQLVSVGIDSWAVDYGLVRLRPGQSPRLAGTPYHYRDERTGPHVDAVHAVVPPADLYTEAGLQFLPFNTVYQLVADLTDGVIDEQSRALLIPDLVGHWLTGALVAERTNASTTGLLDIRHGVWNVALAEKLGLPAGLLPELVDPGTTVGDVTGAAAEAIGATPPVVAVGSHDTASAVVGVPMRDRTTAAYVSCGTWSLVGLELDAPVITEDARAANFTNEGGVDGRVRFLHNVMGLWLLDESIRGWESDGDPVDLAGLLTEAAGLDDPVTIFDANHDSLMRPGADMPDRIAALCREQGDRVPSGRPALARSICESLAVAYAEAVRTAERLGDRRVSTVHLVGGGSQNPLLCQLTADRTGLPVWAGPVEATAIGNVLVQARAAGVLTGDLEALRSLVSDTFAPTLYEPREEEVG